MSVLVVIGAAIVVILGAVHALSTMRSSPEGGPMAPTDDTVRAAMEIPGGLGLAPHLDTTLWRAWAGFNLSHSLGVVIVGLVIGIPALSDFDAALGDARWVALALGAPVLYLVISVRYWFRAPTIGIAVAVAMIAIGVVGGALS